MARLPIIYVIQLHKHGEWYVVTYTRKYRVAAIQTLGRWAADKELDFDWCDASAMAEQMKVASKHTEGST